jgi:crotonobetainyl-CoA:carnitine CoA-transferase CaiB-like acyl-CoA transferase
MTNDSKQPLPGPLDGIRIVEYAIWHAGPGGSAILADMGAEVIKIETLTGDPERTQSRLGTMDFESSHKSNWSFLFELSNRNKKGICLDIHTEKGRQIFHRLIESADVFLTNLRKSTKPRLGVDYATLSKINPKIVHANVSGFGPKGPMSDIGAFDPMGQAISGMVFLTGPDEPVLLQSVVLDQMTAIAASHAMITALFVRERHGIGQEVHVSLYSSALWLMHSNLLATSLLKGNASLPWDRTRNSPLRNCIKCGDGKWLMGTNHPEEKFWPPFCSITGQNHLQNDPLYATTQARGENSVELMKLFDAVFLTRTRDEWLGMLQAEGLMFAPVQTFDEVLIDPQASANNYVVDFDHPSLGQVRVPGYPVHFSANSAGTHAAAPDQGEHTRAVLSEMGYSDSEIHSLQAENVIK